MRFERRDNLASFVRQPLEGDTDLAERLGGVAYDEAECRPPERLHGAATGRDLHVTRRTNHTEQDETTANVIADVIVRSSYYRIVPQMTSLHICKAACLCVGGGGVGVIIQPEVEG